IHRALDLGVNYVDSAPAYSGCLDYLGEALGPRRQNVFLASKTHDRTRSMSIRPRPTPAASITWARRSGRAGRTCFWRRRRTIARVLCRFGPGLLRLPRLLGRGARAAPAERVSGVEDARS